jgi:hypothetical protein
MQINMVVDEAGESRKKFVQETTRIFRKCLRSDFENIGAS